MTVLETPRLILRPRRVDDADALHATFADVELMRYWSGPPHETPADTRADFQRSMRDSAWRAWSITLRGDDTAIGMVAAGEKRQGNVTEIGYILARPHWGAGIAREAVSAIIDRIFAEGQRKVFADTDPAIWHRGRCWRGWASPSKDCCAPNGKRISACAIRPSMAC